MVDWGESGGTAPCSRTRGAGFAAGESASTASFVPWPFLVVEQTLMSTKEQSEL